jgi:hypothetical protein
MNSVRKNAALTCSFVRSQDINYTISAMNGWPAGRQGFLAG